MSSCGARTVATVAKLTRPPVTWAGSHIVERVVRAFAEDMHRRGLLDELSEKSCSRTTAALAKALGDPNLSVLEQKLAAAEQAPPLGLPAVLSSVDDVARVCEAAGFVPAVEDPTFWKDEHDVLVDVVGEYGDDDGLDEVGLQRADDSDVATIHAGAPGWLLWSAIQAARGGEAS